VDQFASQDALFKGLVQKAQDAGPLSIEQEKKQMGPSHKWKKLKKGSRKTNWIVMETLKKRKSRQS